MITKLERYNEDMELLIGIVLMGRRGLYASGTRDGRSKYLWRLSAGMEGDRTRNDTQGCIQPVTESGNVAGTGARARKHTKNQAIINIKRRYSETRPGTPEAQVRRRGGLQVASSRVGPVTTT
jgi:hypothetical protein